jgi:flavodoxin/Pyruvate/2-oxoacid:ferredoxin oxidoreductase delta subunit
MKGLICYHSQSGNTALVCRFLSEKLASVSWDLFDIASGELPDLQLYDVIGFATWTYYLALPPFFEQFLLNLPSQTGKPVFVLNTFGVMPGQALSKMDKALTAKGFLILSGYSFHTPESYPPYIVKGWASLEAPTSKELAEFNAFCQQLEHHLEKIQAGTMPGAAKIKLDLFSRLIQPYSPAKVRREIGDLSVDVALCDQCGTCQQACLYEAISSSLPPIFSAEQCRGCWSCFNHCPQKAIFTGKVKDGGHYPHPAENFSAKLIS